jgi:hypothetical protein
MVAKPFGALPRARARLYASSARFVFLLSCSAQDAGRPAARAIHEADALEVGRNVMTNPSLVSTRTVAHSAGKRARARHVAAASSLVKSRPTPKRCQPRAAARTAKFSQEPRRRTAQHGQGVLILTLGQRTPVWVGTVLEWRKEE